MAIRGINTKVEVQASLDSAKTITAITKANPGVVSSTSHGFSNGDIVVMTSGWSNLNNRVVRVASSATNSFNLEGIDTTSTTLYPALGGAGTATQVTAWTQIAQIMGFSTSGGEQQFTTYSFLENNFESQIPTYFSAMSMTIDIADDPSLAGYLALKAAAEARAQRALRIQMADGSALYYQGYVGFNETPSVSKGQVMTVKASFSLQSRPVRYAS